MRIFSRFFPCFKFCFQFFEVNFTISLQIRLTLNLLVYTTGSFLKITAGQGDTQLAVMKSKKEILQTFSTWLQWTEIKSGVSIVTS